MNKEGHMEEMDTMHIPHWIMGKDWTIQANVVGKESMDNTDLLKALELNKNRIKRELDLRGSSRFGKEQTYIALETEQGIVIHKITEKKSKLEEDELRIAQAELKEHSEKLDAIFNSTAMFIWTINKDGSMSSCNPRFSEQMKIWFERNMEVGEKLFIEPYPQNLDEWARFQEEIKACFCGEKRVMDAKLHTVQEETVWVEIHMDPIKDQDTEDIKAVSCIGFEVTDRVHLDAEIKSSLKEKETLLQEVHHRVKNNLQIISSLMNLQGSYAEDGKTKDLLRESQNRIRSMSFIHESLYMSNNYSAIDLKEYVKGLCNNLLYSYCSNTERMKIVLDIDPIELDLDRAIPCGLIINELVSNTFKHAYCEDEDGELKVCIKEKEGRMAMLIADYGKGIPPDWDPEKSESLGLQLVYTLTEQLDGEIDHSGEMGTEYLITFDRTKNT